MYYNNINFLYTHMKQQQNAERALPVMNQLDLYLRADSPEIYAMHDFIESVIGGSSTRKDFHGSLRLVRDAGRLGDFEKIVDKFEKNMSEVTDADDRFMFGHLVTEARDAIDVLKKLDESKPRDPVSLEIERNSLNASGRIYRQMKRAG